MEIYVTSKRRGYWGYPLAPVSTSKTWAIPSRQAPIYSETLGSIQHNRIVKGGTHWLDGIIDNEFFLAGERVGYVGPFGQAGSRARRSLYRNVR